MPGDSFTPDGGQRIDAQGHVTYDFTGHIHAQGLDLDAGDDKSPPGDRRVRWLAPDGTDDVGIWGAVGGRASLYGHGFGAQVEIATDDDSGASLASARLNVGQHAGSLSGDASVSVDVTGNAGTGPSKLLLDAAGASDWLQLVQTNAAGAHRRIVADFGHGWLHFAGGGLSDSLHVLHGLRTAQGIGLVPEGIWLQAAGTAAGIYSPVYAAIEEGTVTGFGFDVVGRASAGEAPFRDVPFYWLAIAVG